MKKKLVILLALAMILSSFSCFSAAAASVPYTKHMLEASTSGNPNPPGDYAYSFVLVPDTQILTALDAKTTVSTAYDQTNYQGKSYVSNLYQWIVDNAEAKNIQHVFGLGDITQNASALDLGVETQASEWKIATDAIQKLEDAGISYSMVRGNHDDKTEFTKAFTETLSGYTAQFEYVDPDNTSNSYMIKKIGLEKYLFLNLDYAPTKNMLDWANEVVEANQDCKVIVTTHGYMNNLGDPEERVTEYANNGNATGDWQDYLNPEQDGDAIWNNFLKKHENIFMVICGHIGDYAPQITTAQGTNGNTVYQVLADGQDVDMNHGPKGYVATLYFSADGSTFWVEWYSTVDKTWTDLTLECGSDEGIREDTGVCKFETTRGYEFVYGTPRSPLCETKNAASMRVSTPEKSGLRFKTKVDNDAMETLAALYPDADIWVGTLIMPEDMLAGRTFTHTIGEANKDYLDIKVEDINDYFESDATSRTYAGSIVEIQEQNIERPFVGRGYVAVQEEGEEPIYYYSDVSCTRSVISVATMAFCDVSDAKVGLYQNLIEVDTDFYCGKYSPYTKEQRATIKAFTVSKKDAYEFDIFG